MIVAIALIVAIAVALALTFARLAQRGLRRFERPRELAEAAG